jgi:DNA-binding GntR family transcriptional regulator
MVSYLEPAPSVPPLTTPANRRPVPDLAASIRHDLATGVYHPRERLVEADLVARYGTSRGAVREVLIQLTTEGLVERLPNRGARVRGMTLEEAIEIAEVRQALETLCARLAAERATPGERADIKVLAEGLRDAAAANDVPAYLHLNARFHRTILGASHHATAVVILEQFNNRPIDRFFPEPFRPVPPTASVEAHFRIALAVADADADAAGRAMHEHLSALIETLVRSGAAAGRRAMPWRL